MELAYDFHIHTALSPCGDCDMTPNNIVNMSILKGLDVIAITDHNSAGNARAVRRAADGTGLIVLGGLEVETCEAIHVLTIFETPEQAERMGRAVREAMPIVPLREDIYGEQVYYDAEDQKIGNETQLLLVSSNLSIYDIFSMAEGEGGVCIPAHVDRDSYSILASLGAVPPDLSVKLIEISQECRREQFFAAYPELKKYRTLQSSDAHYLENIAEPIHFIDAEAKTPRAVMHALRK